MLKPLQPKKPYRYLRPLEPLRAVTPLEPLQPLQPFSGLPKQSTTIPGYRDPYAVDSLSDVILNKEGRRRQIARQYGMHTEDLPYLAEVVLSGIGMVKEQYAEPVLDGNFFRAGYNALGALAEDVDILSNVTKGAIIESESEWVSAITGGVAALAAVGLTVATGGTAGMAFLAANVAGGMSAVTAAIMNNPEEAVRGMIRGSGLGDEGRHYYVFDVETGNAFSDYTATVLAEMAVDPLNWGSFAYRFAAKGAYALKWSISETTLGVLRRFEQADRLITSAAFYGNPLFGSLKAIVGGTRLVSSLIAKEAIEAANEYAAKMGSSTITEVSNVLQRNDFVKDQVNKILRKAAPTGELAFIKKKDVSQKLFDWYTRLGKYTQREGLPAEVTPKFIKEYMHSLWYGDDSVFLAISKNLSDDVKDTVISFGKEFLEITGTSAGVIRHYKDAGFEKAQKMVEAFLDSVIDTGSVGNMIRNTVEMDVAGISEAIVKQAGGAEALSKMTYAERLPFIFNALVERFPELNDKKLASMDKTSTLYKVLDSMANGFGVSLDEVVSYRMARNEVLYSPDALNKAVHLLEEMNPGANVVRPRKIGLLPMADSLKQGSVVTEQLPVSKFIKDTMLVKLLEGGFTTEETAVTIQQMIDDGIVVRPEEILNAIPGIKVRKIADEAEVEMRTVLKEFFLGMDSPESVSITNWILDMNNHYPDLYKALAHYTPDEWADLEGGAFIESALHELTAMYESLKYLQENGAKMTPLKLDMAYNTVAARYAKLTNPKYIKEYTQHVNFLFHGSMNETLMAFHLVRPQWGVLERMAVRLHGEGNKYVLQMNKRAVSLDLFHKLSRYIESEDPNEFGLGQFFEALGEGEKEPMARVLIALASIDLSETSFAHIGKAAKTMLRQVTGLKQYGQLIASVNDILNSTKTVSTSESLSLSEKRKMIPLKIANKGDLGKVVDPALAPYVGKPEKPSFRVYKGTFKRANAAVMKPEGKALNPVPAAEVEEMKTQIEETLKAHEHEIAMHQLKEKNFRRETEIIYNDALNEAKTEVKQVDADLKEIPNASIISRYYTNRLRFHRYQYKFDYQKIFDIDRRWNNKDVGFGPKTIKGVAVIKERFGPNTLPAKNKKGHFRFDVSRKTRRKSYVGVLDKYGIRHKTTETITQLEMMETRIGDGLLMHRLTTKLDTVNEKRIAKDRLADEISAKEIQSKGTKQEWKRFVKEVKFFDGSDYDTIYEAQKPSFLEEFMPPEKRSDSNQLTIKQVQRYVHKLFDELEQWRYYEDKKILIAPNWEELDHATQVSFLRVFRDIGRPIPKNVIFPDGFWGTYRKAGVKYILPERLEFTKEAVSRYLDVFDKTGDINKATEELFKNADGSQNERLVERITKNAKIFDEIVEPELSKKYGRIKQIGPELDKLIEQPASPHAWENEQRKSRIATLRGERNKLFRQARELKDLYKFTPETQLEMANEAFHKFVGQNRDFRDSLMHYDAKDLKDIFGEETYEDFIKPTVEMLSMFFPERVVKAHPLSFYRQTKFIWDSAKINAYNRVRPDMDRDVVSRLAMSILVNDDTLTHFEYLMDGPLTASNGNKAIFNAIRSIVYKSNGKLDAIIVGPDEYTVATPNYNPRGKLNVFPDPFKRMFEVIFEARKAAREASGTVRELYEGIEYVDTKKRIPYTGEDAGYPKQKRVFSHEDGLPDMLRGKPVPEHLTVSWYLKSLSDDVNKSTKAITAARKELGISSKEVPDSKVIDALDDALKEQEVVPFGLKVGAVDNVNLEPIPGYPLKVIGKPEYTSFLSELMISDAETYLKPDTIREMTGEYSYLSNFFGAKVMYQGKVYPTSEHAYQAAKAANEADAERIRTAPTAMDAKKLGGVIKMVDNWDSIKDRVMYDIVLAKFRQNPTLAAKLMATGKRAIFEGNSRGAHTDTYWGFDKVNHKGQNKLGHILDNVRSELKRTSFEVATTQVKQGFQHKPSVGRGTFSPRVFDHTVTVGNRAKGITSKFTGVQVVKAARSDGHVFGNPFYLPKGADDNKRAEVVEQYNDWFRAEYVKKEDVFNEVQRLARKVANGEKIELACFCAPKQCHLDIVAETIKIVAARLKENDALDKVIDSGVFPSGYKTDLFLEVKKQEANGKAVQSAGTYWWADGRISLNTDKIQAMYRKEMFHQGEGVTLVPSEAFATVFDFLEFVVRHEEMHHRMGYQQSNETLAQYEERVNQAAYNEYMISRSAMPPERANLDKAPMSDVPTYDVITESSSFDGKYESKASYIKRVKEAMVAKKMQSRISEAYNKWVLKAFPELLPQVSQMTGKDLVKFAERPRLPAPSDARIQAIKQEMRTRLSRWSVAQSLKEEDLNDFLSGDEKQRDLIINDMLKDSPIEQADGSIVFPDSMPITHFEQVEEPIVPADLAKKVFNILMNQLEGNHMRRAADVLSLYSAEKFKARVLLIPGMENQVEMAEEIGKQFMRYLELQADAGASVVDLPSHSFNDAMKIFFDDEAGVRRLLDEVDSLEVKKGFSMAAVDAFMQKFVTRSTMLKDMDFRHTASSDLSFELKNVERTNQEIEEYYIEAIADDINTILGLEDIVGAIGFDKHPRFMQAIEHFNRTGSPFENKLYQGQRKLTEKEMMDNPGMTEADRNLKHQKLVQSTTNDPSRELEILHDEEEFQLATTTDYWTADVKKTDTVLRYITRLHVHNAYAYKSMSNVLEAAAKYPGPSHHFMRASGYKHFDTIKYKVLTEMQASELAAFFHHQTFGFFPISRLVTQGVSFHPQILEELRSVYGIGIIAEDKNYICFDVLDPSKKSLVGKPTRTLTIDNVGDRSFAQELDSLHEVFAASVDNVLPFDLRLGGVPRINGKALAAFALNQKFITEARAEQLIVDSQYSGEMRMMMLGPYEMYKDVIEWDGHFAPGTPMSMIQASLFSIISHSNAKTIYLKHVFAPQFRPAQLFSPDPKIAHQMFMSNKNFRAIALKGTEVIDVTHLVRQGPKQMAWAMKNGVAITTWSGMVHLYKKTNKFEMPKVMDWFNRYIMTAFRAGMLTPVTGFRNFIDNLPRALLAAKGDFDVLSKLPVAASLLKESTELLKRMENLNSFEAFRDAYLLLTPDEQRKITLIQMFVKYKVINTPLEGLMELSADARMEKILRGVTVDEANIIQKIAWENPWTKMAVGLMGYGEQVFRLATVLHLLETGMEMPEIADEVLRYFIDYSYRPPSVQVLNTFMPFAIFAVANTAMWADSALENPFLLRLLLQASTETTIDREHRELGSVSRFEMQQALSGNVQMGRDLYKVSPSLFDALGMALNIADDPISRASPHIQDIDGFLRGEETSISYPFEGEVNKIAKIIHNLSIGNTDSVGDVLPWVAFPTSSWTKTRKNYGYSNYTRPSGLVTGFRYNSRTGYSLVTGYSGEGKMAARYGGLPMRSSNYQRKVYIHRGFYKSLYTSTGKSRLGIRANTKPTYRNLAARIKDQSYMFK